MKKFRFTLDAVLKLKRASEDAALKQFGAATRRRQEALLALESARRQMGALLTAIRQAREAGAVSGWAQAAYVREVSRQEAICKHAEEFLTHCTKEETAAREHYLKCRREAETIEKLGQKRLQEHQKQLSRALELELEEIVLSKEHRLCNRH